MSPTKVNKVTKYPSTGEQTQLTPLVQKTAKQFSSNKLELIFEILRWINKNIRHKKLPPEEKDMLFRKRTAHEIIKSKFSTGCTDFTITFIALSRAKHIPTNYVELLDKNWLRSQEEEKTIRGHTIAEIETGKRKYYVDPTHSNISTKLPSGMTIYEKGLDSWDIGVFNHNWRKKFLDFKKQKSGVMGIIVHTQ
ncbi:hypothetical protein KKB83_05545 [Patescibacteria group bacterium]|nr:hypothetical protein [Patescibacteria group bacterium]